MLDEGAGLRRERCHLTSPSLSLITARKSGRGTGLEAEVGRRTTDPEARFLAIFDADGWFRSPDFEGSSQFVRLLSRQSSSRLSKSGGVAGTRLDSTCETAPNSADLLDT